MSFKYVQGIFIVKNPQKYKGDPRNVIYRSSWEKVAFEWLDNNPNVVSWSSEETVIRYINPWDNRVHRYFVDLKFDFMMDGVVKTFLVEIKPKAQTKKPIKTEKKRQDVFLKENHTYHINQAKWAAARKVCEAQGWEFVIWTEDQLIPKPRRYKRNKQ